MSDLDNGTVVRDYVDAVGARDLEPLEVLLDPGLVATFAGDRSDREEWIAALRGLLPVLVRNDIREVFTAGDRVSIVYDFVTDTPAGAVTCVELATVRDGRITEIELLLDRVAFAPVDEALRALASR